MAVVGRSGRPLQLTLALLKPDAVAHPLVLEAVHETILSNQFLIVRAKQLRCGREESRRFYREHAARRGGHGGAGAAGREPAGPRDSGRLSPAGRFFYQRLVEFMASGPMWAYILAHENAVPLWRSLMGPTKVFRARNSVPDSIRGAYGLTDTRNTTHGSDSPASASREIAFFFPEFNEQLWYQQEEPRLRCGQVYYNAEKRVHCVFRDEETELT
ncbi:nucleoside diphosphate kinase 6 isoform X1 [Falco biarmicus]|uniref:nucleoside diphosphate kinase 6 isoform X1 n=1 Tax=Falco peregrinus TaxID=8954 RepID=UPI00247B0161|nr:nucleoside diphosphate kinase 6 isoform X1 [Falco peregrinus]XP_055664867.1 nucleoside diphosphate kinase 6 isoform X1 [Falco peregrinus]XP_056197348.1 nucleoside diphosphate kinase 6 isoform X1 [Falco biarmicus]XP_056197349.1 nucleoside diphosphate kinase 6 isoform X1 [Falco biarmicus]